MQAQAGCTEYKLQFVVRADDLYFRRKYLKGLLSIPCDGRGARRPWVSRSVSPHGHLSRRSDTEQISWGKLSHFPCTIAESTLRTLMDTDFAVSCPLVRHGRLLFGFCPSTRTFVPCFLRTSPRGDSPCIITRPSPPSGRPEDFHLQVTEHAQHTTKPLARRTLPRARYQRCM